MGALLLETMELQTFWFVVWYNWLFSSLSCRATKVASFTSMWMPLCLRWHLESSGIHAPTQVC